MPRLTGVLETSLYVTDLNRAAAFYERVFDLTRLDGDARFCALEVPGRQVLLLFLQGAATTPIRFPSGTIPPHDGAGRLHVAFSIPGDEVAAWETELRRQGVPVESRVAWPRGGTSLYFRDPDGHLVELATPGLWWSE